MGTGTRPLDGTRSQADDGRVDDDLELPDDHPGVLDPVYRRRRAEIAAVATSHVPGRRPPEVAYTSDEDALWALVTGELRRRHQRWACAAYLAAADRLDLPADHIPQLGEVVDRLRPLTGFRVEPVGGLVPTRRFYGSLAERCFLSTQYLRHPSVPFYTPEPDLIHEALGHMNTLADPQLAELHHLAGEASLRCASDEALEFFSRVFWFSLEFGVVHEGGELRTYGAGLLSSYAEIECFHQAEVRPLDLVAMGTTPYDITHYQPLLFAGRSFDHVVDELGRFFSTFDDDEHARLVGRADVRSSP